MNNWIKIFPIRPLSLRQRLPLLICVLLLGTVVIFSWITYIGVKNAALKTGKERLSTLTGQLSSMFSQSAHTTLVNSRIAASEDPIVKYMQGDHSMEVPAKQAIKKLQHDNTWVLVELKGANGKTVLRSGRDSVSSPVNFDSVLEISTLRDSAAVGKFYSLHGSIYYAITVPVLDKKQVIGHLVRWRLQTATPKSLEQLSQLMGTGAKLYFGNSDGSLWTNLIRPVQFGQLDTAHIHGPFEFTDPGSKEKVIAAVQPIANTPWVVSILFSQEIVLQTAKHFLRWIVLIGVVLIAIGIFAGWLMSRNITRPLNKLTAAALAITHGDYSIPVDVDRNDELGTLATAFNSMAIQVRNAKQDLEKKVAERTVQLETANREMESFSYSISHDLRAPLRAIIGFTTILKEEYVGKLGEDAIRITTIIKENTQKMGHLIDDLLAFSRMGRQDINKTSIDTDGMVKNVINEMAHGMNNIEWIVQPLPEMKGDINLIRQVWINLISNAIKYSGNREKPRIEIGTFRREGQTVFFIKDNGVGFNEEYKDKLFKVFQRLHSDDEFEGTGIGLALVEKIISKHAGKVWGESVLDKGATFYFSLPV